VAGGGAGAAVGGVAMSVFCRVSSARISALAEPRPPPHVLHGAAGDLARTEAEHDGGSEVTDLSTARTPLRLPPYPEGCPGRVAGTTRQKPLPPPARYKTSGHTASSSEPARLRQLYVAEIKPYHYARRCGRHRYIPIAFCQTAL